MSNLKITQKGDCGGMTVEVREGILHSSETFKKINWFFWRAHRKHSQPRRDGNEASLKESHVLGPREKTGGHAPNSAFSTK